MLLFLPVYSVGFWMVRVRNFLQMKYISERGHCETSEGNGQRSFPTLSILFAKHQVYKRKRPHQEDRES